MSTVIYEVTYNDGQKTVHTDLTDAILIVRDTYISAKVNCWCNGNCVATMEINSANTKTEK